MGTSHAEKTESEILETAEEFVHAVAAGDWEIVRNHVADDFTSSEGYISPDSLIQSFGDRDWESVTPILADHFHAGENELAIDEMIEDLADHYQMFEPSDCKITKITAEPGPVVVFMATHTEIHADVYVGIEPTGDPVAWDELGVLRFEDGLVKERRVTYDLDSFHVQLGIRHGRADTPISQRGTQIKVQQQFYRVLNRLLRHNIRNDLTYVRGYAEVVADEVGSDSNRVDGIIEFADDLIDTAEKVRVLEERVLNPEEDRDVNIEETVAATIESVRNDYPNSEITLSGLDEPLSIHSNAAILEVVVGEAIENGIEHNDADEPRVKVNIETESIEEKYAVVISITDNGPGIPEHEIRPLEQEVETSLEHASGIGLWAIKWGIEQLGGQVKFEDIESRGTEIRLPLVDFSSLD